jgi:2-amino-4-hydroxy-6-hydroxymethyldihydropteridine diphosphokinase
MCELSPYELLNYLKDIERAHDRVRHEKWGSRTLDLDIIAFGEQRLDTPELTIPHAYFKERGFVLEPLAEIYPDWFIEGASVRQHFQNWLREFS